MPRRHIRRFLVCISLFFTVAAHGWAQEKAVFSFEKGDRVTWVGSSSTNIGVWPKTMEFLLRTRHPELELTFKKFSTGGGTFATGVQNLDKWLDDFHPTVVVFNYGSNDAGAGEKGLPVLKENITKCVAKAEAAKARVLFSLYQGADVRKSGEAPATRRKLYAETQLAFCKEKGWPVVDVYHPIDELQRKGQKDDDKYTILRDTIHLTDPAYIAWGYYLYDGLKLKGGVSELELDVSGSSPKAVKQIGCKVGDLTVSDESKQVRFVRTDAVLPILPPGTLPPRAHVPLERCSPYVLRVRALPEGKYKIRCEDKDVGSATAQELAAGVNLNTLILNSGVSAPWEALAKQIWAGKDLDRIGKTTWHFSIDRE